MFCFVSLVDNRLPEFIEFVTKHKGTNFKENKLCWKSQDFFLKISKLLNRVLVEGWPGSFLLDI